MDAQPISQLVSRSVSWLWPGRLALGKLSLLDGDPGLGKSLITLDLAARLSTGRPFPDGSPSPGPATVLLLNAEDNPQDTLRPRLQALGADLERIFIPRPDKEGDLLRLPNHVATLDRLLTQSDARFAVIDPITAYLDSSVQLYSDASVRRALLPLAAVAEQHACAPVMIRHLNKTGGAQSMYRGLGSIGFLASCRTALLVTRDPHDPQRCVLAQLKNNLAPPQPSLVYQVEAHGQDPPTLTWHGPTSWLADQLLAAAPARPRDHAREFLAAFLEAGPRPVRDLWEAARQQGLSERTLNRAKKELNIRSASIHVDGRPVHYWLLRGQELPGAQPESDLHAYLRKLDEQYPPPTPLDDL